MSTTSKWAALLRVRTGPECPVGNLRELTWDSNPNCGIARDREKERENFSVKSSNLRHCRPAHRTKDWANTRGELAGCGPAHSPPEAERQAGNSQSQKERGNLGPETASSTKLQAGSQLLTKSSWDPGRLTSARRVTAGDQLPRGHIWPTWDGAPAAHPGFWAAGTREVIRCTAHLGRLRSPSTWSPELLGPGKGTKHRPNRVCTFVECLRKWTSAA